MGQSSSSQRRSILATSHPSPHNTHTCIDTCTDRYIDYTSYLPDECLALIFQTLSSGNRKACSSVCKRWLVVEGQNHQRLSLNAQAEIVPWIPSIFSRFDSVTKLALRCDRRSKSIDDEALIVISGYCPNLSRLKLRGCRELTDVGMTGLAKNCPNLKKLSCGSCVFGVKGMNAILDHCSALEELSVKRLRGINDAAEPIGPGVAASSLKSVCLKELYNGQCFAPLIVGAKNLKSLKLLRCLGDWDGILENISKPNNSLFEVHLERLQVSDIGIKALSNCSGLEILHLVKTPDCTNLGLVSVAERCKLLRKLHIDGWRANRIGDEGLLAIAKHSTNLQELVLIGVNPNLITLEAIATSCQKLERLALCGSETIGDSEISCVAAKCGALKKLCIKGCPVSDQGIEAFAWGCPNLVKIKVKKCRAVTGDVAGWLRVRRGSLVVSLDVCEVETDVLDASASDGGAQEEIVELPPIVTQTNAAELAVVPSSSSSSRSVFRPRFGLFGGRSFMPGPFRRCSNNGSNLLLILFRMFVLVLVWFFSLGWFAALSDFRSDDVVTVSTHRAT